MAVLNDLVYAMGGYDGYERQNTAERYNYKTNQWSLITPMHVHRSDASATTLNGTALPSRCPINVNRKFFNFRNSSISKKFGNIHLIEKMKKNV